MEDRFNLGNDVRDLKLGASFRNPNSRTKFHTLKYDFKPASVDVNKAAKLDVSSNNQVTVTVPHLDGSGVPNTVFKGNQRDYTKKECVLIINRETGEIILERLHNNIQVKKTRHESASKNNNLPIVMAKNHLENHTTRFSSKTKVSTGNRNNRNTINFIPKHSPIQNSPSYPHKSPQGATAPVWNANNTQQTLPSIPIIGLDDVHENYARGSTSSYQPTSNTAMVPSLNTLMSHNDNINNNNNHGSVSNNTSHLQNNHHMTNIMDMSSSSIFSHHGGVAIHNHNNVLEPNNDGVGLLSSSDSSDSSESSGSGSDSDSDEDNNVNSKGAHLPGQQQQNQCPTAQHTHFLSEDLRLSESNSDSDD